MKIAFFEVQDWERDYLEEEFHREGLQFFAEKLSADNAHLAKDCDVVSIFIESVVANPILDELSEVKLITTRSTGFDHINIKSCKDRKVVVCNVPHYGDNTVAEHAFALLLDLSRKVHQSIYNVKESGFSVKGLVGFDLQGKTLGVIGTGRIGAHVIRIARGFEMNVVAYDVMVNKKLARQLGFTYVSLEELLKTSDIVTIHAPYNEKTHHLINGKNIGLMKQGSYLINTARGGIVETQALVDALSGGRLAGAGLDVLEEENMIREESQLLSEGLWHEHNMVTVAQNHMLMERENVIITPHNAFNSVEARERILKTTCENIRAFAKKKPINIVS